jgi:hypothetical protein
MAGGPHYIASAQTTQKTQFQAVTLFLAVTQPFPSNGCFSCYRLLALSRYATVYYIECVWTPGKVLSHDWVTVGVVLD